LRSHLVLQASYTKLFTTRSELFIKKLFVAYVRPMLEYASSLWSPVGTGLVRDIERVQRRFTKRLPGLRSMTYDERLVHLQLESLEVRRRRADLIIVHKALRGHLGVEASRIGLVPSTAPTRNAGVNLTVNRPINNTVGNVFGFRVSKHWNALSKAAKSDKTLSLFKKNLLKQSLLL
jgi:hypothetical protein